MSQSAGAVNGQPHDDRGPAVDAVQIAMIILVVAGVTLRFLARRIGGSQLLWDDWTIVIAGVWNPFATSAAWMARSLRMLTL